MDKRMKLLFSGILIFLIFFTAYSFIDTNNAFGQNEIHTNTTIVENGSYFSQMDVAAYIDSYHKLPHNYITKSEARKLGWEGGSVERYAPGKAIGGDKFSNRQGSLPDGENYIECDINTNGSSSRGAERIVYSTDDYDIYYTGNHYDSFTKLN